MKHFLTLICFFSISVFQVYSSEPWKDFVHQTIQTKPKNIESFAMYYLPISDLKKMDHDFEKIDHLLKNERWKLLNELAYITTIVRRSYTEKPFVMLRQMKYRIVKQDEYMQGVYYFVFARLLFSIQKKDMAVVYNLKSIELLKITNEKSALKNAYINQGYYYSHSDLKKAYLFYQKAIDTEKQGVNKLHLDLRTNLAYWSLMNRDPKQAMRYYLEAKEQYDASAEHNYIDDCRLLSTLSSIYDANGDREHSNEYMEKAKQIAAKYHLIDFQKQIADEQSRRFFESGNYQLAYERLREVDSLTKLIALNKISEGIAVYDLKHKFIEEKKEKKRVQEIVKIQKKQQQILWTSLLLITVALIGISILLQKIKAKNSVLIQQNLKLATAETPRMKIGTNEPKDVSLELIVELEKLIYDKKIYEKANLTIDKLAKRLNTNRTYLSEAINTHYKENYSSWINEIRINASRKLLASKEYDHYSIDGISKMVGYSSISNFNNSFKKITGLTPSQFKKTRSIYSPKKLPGIAYHE